MEREKFAVLRECHRCQGSGLGGSRVVCHICKGNGIQTFHLYALDLEGAELITYVAPPFETRQGPRLMEGERRQYMFGEEAHREGLERLQRGEIVSYVVKGHDDFSRMTPEIRDRAVAAYGREIEQRTAARAASEEFPWEEEEQARYDLERLGQIARSPLDGCWYLTSKGVARIQAVLMDGEELTPWTEQCVKLLEKGIYLTEKGAE